MALLAPAAGAVDQRCGLWLKAPDLDAAFPAGAVVVDYEVEVSCGGIGSVEGMPDGWSTQLLHEGEQATLRISSGDATAWFVELGMPDRRASNAQIEAVVVGVLTRGQWSDCMGFDARAIAQVPAADGTWTRARVAWHRSLGDRGWTRADAAPAP
jgi:hypothetical protein